MATTRGHALHHGGQQLVGRDVLGLALEVQDQAMAQGRIDGGQQVVAGDFIPGVGCGADFGRQRQGLCAGEDWPRNAPAA